MKSNESGATWRGEECYHKLCSQEVEELITLKTDQATTSKRPNPPALELSYIILRSDYSPSQKGFLSAKKQKST